MSIDVASCLALCLLIAWIVADVLGAWWVVGYLVVVGLILWDGLR